MSNRDFMLVMNMLYFLMEKRDDEQSDVAPQIEQFKGALQALVEGKDIPSMQAGAESPRDDAAQKEEVEGLERKIKSLREELSSNQQMMQMTITHMTDELERKKKAQKIANSLSEQLFERSLNVGQKLRLVFPESFCHTASSGDQSHFMYMSNRIGITYLVVVGTPWEGILASQFRMASYLILNQVINEKRFINSSHLVEEFEKACSLFEGFDEEQRKQLADIKVSVLIIDKNRFEAEFSSNGPSCFCAYKNTLEETKGGLINGEGSVDGLEINKYRTSHLNIREQSRFYLSSFDQEATFLSRQEEEKVYSLSELLQRICSSDMNTQNQKVKAFFEQHTNQTSPEGQHLLLGLKF